MPQIRKTDRCKAISKSTGERCKKPPVKNGFCEIHQPRTDGTDTITKLKGGALGTVIVKNLIDILTNLPSFLDKSNQDEYRSFIESLDESIQAAWDKGSLDKEELTLLKKAGFKAAWHLGHTYNKEKNLRKKKVVKFRKKRRVRKKKA